MRRIESQAASHQATSYKQQARGDGPRFTGRACQERGGILSIKPQAASFKLETLRLASFIIFVFLAFCGAALADDGKTSTVPVISGIEIADNTVLIKATGGPLKYRISKPDNPFRVIVDIEGVRLGNYTGKITSQKAGITEIVPQQIEAPQVLARLDILMPAPAEVTAEAKDSTLIVKVAAGGALEAKQPATVKPEETRQDAGAGAPSASLPAKTQDKPSSASNPAAEIRQIAFEREDDKTAIIIKGDGIMPEPSVYITENQITVDIPSVAMRADIPNVMQPVSNMKYTIEKGKIRFSMSLAGEAWTDVFTLDDEVIILFSVPAKAEKAVVAQQNITGRKEKKADIKEDVQVKDQDQERRVSLDFQDADVTAVLRLLADVSGYNIVVHPEIKGKITMKLINVPWEQALDVVLQTFALGKGMEGNIIKVTPLSILSKDQEDRAKAKEADRKAEPLETKPYRISNADVYDIETAIKDAKVLSERGNISAVANPARDVRTQDQVDKFGSGSSGGGGGGGGTGQSSATGGGENLFRKRTGVLVVTDISAKLLVIDKLVALLDRVPEQVLIEARIVEMDKNNSVDFGVQWGINYKSPNTLNYIGGTNPITGRNYAVDFPAVTSVPNPLLQGAGLAFGLMNLAGTLSLDAKISALEEAKKGKVISMPKILTTSDQKARIIQGESIPYISSMAAGTPPTATVSFKDVAISIHVTPHVTPDGKIVLNVLTLKEDLVEMIDIGGGSQAPRTKKIEGNTRVTVNNGETLVIGGIYQKQEKDETSGTPGLMRIPILGWLFKEQLKEEKVKELVIFITPKIIEPNVAR